MVPTYEAAATESIGLKVAGTDHSHSIDVN